MKSLPEVVRSPQYQTGESVFRKQGRGSSLSTSYELAMGPGTLQFLFNSLRRLYSPSPPTLVMMKGSLEEANELPSSHLDATDYKPVLSSKDLRSRKGLRRKSVPSPDSRQIKC